MIPTSDENKNLKCFFQAAELKGTSRHTKWSVMDLRRLMNLQICILRFDCLLLASGLGFDTVPIFADGVGCSIATPDTFSK